MIVAANALIVFIVLLNCYLKGYLNPDKIRADYLTKCGRADEIDPKSNYYEM